MRLPSPAELVNRARELYRSAEKTLARRAGARALLAVPRTTRFALRSLFGNVGPEGDSRPPSPSLLAHVAMDETILAVAMAPNRFPRRAEYQRVSVELAEARELFADRGWLADPALYHVDPPPLRGGIVTTRGWAMGLPYEQIHFESGFEPRPEEPGAARWDEVRPNHTAVATVLRHPDGPRPWVVALHGFAMGYPFMDFVGLRAGHLHRKLGLNVVLPVLPMHGPRKVTRLGGEQFLSFDLMNTVHGLAQSVWDVRRIVSWIEAQEPEGIGLYGISLGGLAAALLAGLAGPFSFVMVGVPVSDFAALLKSHSPHHIRLRSIEHNILGGPAETVHRVVCPLQFEPHVAADRRFIFAGVGDRLAPPMQATALWQRWGRPRIAWYPGNHVGYLWSSQVRSFLDQSLADAGFLAPAYAGR